MRRRATPEAAPSPAPCMTMTREVDLRSPEPPRRSGPERPRGPTLPARPTLHNTHNTHYTHTWIASRAGEDGASDGAARAASGDLAINNLVRPCRPEDLTAEPSALRCCIATYTCRDGCRAVRPQAAAPRAMGVLLHRVCESRLACSKSGTTGTSPYHTTRVAENMRATLAGESLGLRRNSGTTKNLPPASATKAGGWLRDTATSGVGRAPSDRLRTLWRKHRSENHGSSSKSAPGAPLSGATYLVGGPEHAADGTEITKSTERLWKSCSRYVPKKYLRRTRRAPELHRSCP